MGSGGTPRLGAHSPQVSWISGCRPPALHHPSSIAKLVHPTPACQGWAFKGDFFSPSVAQTLLFLSLTALPTDNTGGFPWGAHTEQLAPLSGSHSLIWQPILAPGSQHLSGEEGWVTSCPHRAPTVGLSAWPPPRLAKHHQTAALRHPQG